MFRHPIRLVLLSLTVLASTPASHSAPLEAKRRNPAVLAPVEFQADTALVCVRFYMIRNEPDGKVYSGLIFSARHGREIRWVNEEELKQLPAPEFARDILPLPVVVVTASFPYRKQVEAFQEALRLRSLADLRDEPGAFPHVLGLNVERRETAPDKTDWQALDLESEKSPYLGILAQTRKEPEPEPEGWKPAHVSGLTMPLPVLTRGRYPECSLPLLAKTLGDPKAAALPDYGLLRFLDVTVQPGHSYEYCVRVRMANPNHGMKTKVEDPAFAEPKELLGPWARVPGTVALGPDLLYYAVDMKLLDPRFPGRAAGRNEVAFQAHRWIGIYYFSRARRTDCYPVGSWVVAERILVPRGECVGGRQPIKLPTWSPEESRYVVAGRPGGDGVDVDFSPDFKVERAPLLVDFEGGRMAYKGVGTVAPVEVLLLSADGRLLARNSQADVADPERWQRQADWRKWLRDGKLP
jgi:hypothetical protein